MSLTNSMITDIITLCDRFIFGRINLPEFRNALYNVRLGYSNENELKEEEWDYIVYGNDITNLDIVFDDTTAKEISGLVKRRLFADIVK